MSIVLAGGYPKEPAVPVAEKTPLRVGISEGYVALQFAGLRVMMTPDEADEISAAIRNYAVELRNGGQVT